MIEMLEEYFISAMLLSILFSLIPLAASLIIGFVVAILQAATQIQESTLSFVPKVFIVAAVLAMVGPWCRQEVTELFQNIIETVSRL